MDQRTRNLTYVLAATLGAGVFWGGLGEVIAPALTPQPDQHQIQRPGEPHPGKRDDALKAALRGDWGHEPLSYVQARNALFGSVDGDGRKVEGRYTGETIRYLKQPLPNKGVVEHAWPLTRLPEQARSDLHHMYAVIPEARMARVNLRYGRVLVAVWSGGGSRSGPSRRIIPAFEVRPEQRGDIARSMFYVATMYELEIPQAEERTLRTWHASDPVSSEERGRNDRVVQEQSSRNPFVDHPGLTRRISDF